MDKSPEPTKILLEAADRDIYIFISTGEIPDDKRTANVNKSNRDKPSNYLSYISGGKSYKNLRIGFTFVCKGWC